MGKTHALRGIVVAIGLAIGTAGCQENVTEPESVAQPPAAKPPRDLRAFIETSLASGAKEIVIPPGQYRVTPQNREHLKLVGLRDVTIVADGVEMICTETTRAITIENCENLTIRGLTIDYDPLPFTQARILSISPDQSRLEVEILEGYPDVEDRSGSVEIFDPETNQLRGRLTYFNTRSQPTEPGRALLIKSGTRTESTGEKPGDIAIIKTSHAPGGEIPHAIMATDCKNLVLKNVTLFAANTFGFFENRCDGSRYLDCRVDRRSPESDRVPRGHPRLRSLNADAYHSKNARVGPAYERCFARFMGDDAIAINGDFHLVTQNEGPSLRVLAKFSMTMQPGDEVQIFRYDGTRLPNRKIVSLTEEGLATEAERQFLADRKMNDRMRKTGLSAAYRVILDEAVSVPPGTLICSANRIGNGFAIRDCDIGFNRSRGILVKAGRGEITGNTIEGSVMTAILISPEYWWLEAGLADDLLIAGNRISHGEGMGIAVVAEGGDGSLAPAGAFQNLTLRDNVIEGGAAPGLLLTSIRGLIEEGNAVQTDPSKSLYSWQIGPWGTGGGEPVMKVHVE